MRWGEAPDHGVGHAARLSVVAPGPQHRLVQVPAATAGGGGLRPAPGPRRTGWRLFSPERSRAHARHRAAPTPSSAPLPTPSSAPPPHPLPRRSPHPLPRRSPHPPPRRSPHPLPRRPHTLRRAIPRPSSAPPTSASLPSSERCALVGARALTLVSRRRRRRRCWSAWDVPAERASAGGS